MPKIEIPEPELDDEGIELRDKLQDWPLNYGGKPTQVIIDSTLRRDSNVAPQGAQPFKTDEEKAQEAQEINERRLNRGND